MNKINAVALNNVTSIVNKNIFQTIQVFLDSYPLNTRKSYERNIRLFFNVTLNKEVENVSFKDLKRIKLTTLTEYQTLMKKSGEYKNSTINQNMESIRSLFKYFKGNEINVNIDMFSLVKRLPDDKVNVGFMSVDEVSQIAELALFERFKPFEKKIVILLAFETSIRKNAILNIKYDHIKPNLEKKGFYIIESEELFDKGSMVKEKGINPKTYQLLMQLKEINNSNDDDFIFDLKYDQLTPMVKRLAKNAGIDRFKDLSFHSIKRAGVHLAFEERGLHAAQMQGGHKSVDTTTGYIKRESNVVSEIMYEDVDKNIFYQLSKEEMIELLKSFDNGLGVKLRRKAKEIIDER